MIIVKTSRRHCAIILIKLYNIFATLSFYFGIAVLIITTLFTPITSLSASVINAFSVIFEALVKFQITLRYSKNKERKWKHPPQFQLYITKRIM